MIFVELSLDVSFNMLPIKGLSGSLSPAIHASAPQPRQART